MVKGAALTEKRAQGEKRAYQTKPEIYILGN